jgi:NADPH2:quinone reductase
MTHAIRFHKAGGPEVLVWEEVSLGKPGPGEARIRQTAVGLNFVDIYNRSGVYPVSAARAPVWSRKSDPA